MSSHALIWTHFKFTQSSYISAINIWRMSSNYWFFIFLFLKRTYAKLLYFLPPFIFPLHQALTAIVQWCGNLDFFNFLILKNFFLKLNCLEHLYAKKHYELWSLSMCVPVIHMWSRDFNILIIRYLLSTLNGLHGCSKHIFVTPNWDV